VGSSNLGGVIGQGLESEQGSSYGIASGALLVRKVGQE
jgi:hypothetical protein